MTGINNWQVTRSQHNPFLLQLNADNSLTFMSAGQARAIAAALIKVANDMEGGFDRSIEAYRRQLA